MTRYGVISDIHGNLHALQAVLPRMGELAVEELICLGDVVGYGPHPDTCLDIIYKHCSIIVQGNHDEAVVDPHCTRLFNGPARDAILWTIDNIGPLHLDALNRMKQTARIGKQVLCVHASPAPAPTSDYIHDKKAAAYAFRGVDVPICLIGHTHVPMIFEASPEAGVEPEMTDLVAYLPGDGVEHPLEGDRRYICNPGSVGQPRDCDPRASFAVLDTGAGTFTVYRQEYDVCAAQAAAQRAGLPTVLAERLAIGA